MVDGEILPSFVCIRAAVPTVGIVTPKKRSVPKPRLGASGGAGAGGGGVAFPPPGALPAVVESGRAVAARAAARRYIFVRDRTMSRIRPKKQDFPNRRFEQIVDWISV